MKKLIVGNWKMNPNSYEEAEQLASRVLQNTQKINNTKIVLCPPFPWLTDLSHKMKGISWGAQDMFWLEKGAFTGEVSPAMLKNSGVAYVIIGHSERRQWLGETDEMINKKVLAALMAELTVILCVGEPKEVRKKGFAAAKKFVDEQLKKDLSFSHQSPVISRTLVVAYEPIWAVGTGVTDKPEDSAKMAEFIKSKTGEEVIYGGSITSKNARGFFERKEIRGALVGGASLDAQEFGKIASMTF